MSEKENFIYKTRTIPLSEYFSILQLEWLSYKFRELLYERDFDKQQFSRFCKQKREIIEGVARKNCLPCIFDSRSQAEKYIRVFLNENKTFPQFQYRDEHQVKHKGFWDKVYYYKTGCEFTYLFSNEVCVLQNVNVKLQEALVSVSQNNVFLVPLDKIIRIFDSNFIQKIFS